METKHIYDLMLPYFTGDDKRRPELSQVHGDKNGYLYASDGIIIIRMQKEKAGREYDEVPDFPSAESVIQYAIDRENTKSTVETAKLIQLLSCVAWTRIKDGDTCKECDGEGVVECTYCGHESKCKECDGTGVVNMRIKEYSLLKSKDNYMIKIGALTYRAEYLYIIALFAQMLQIEEIEYLHNGLQKGRKRI
jgi:hypothetical protein